MTVSKIFRMAMVTVLILSSTIAHSEERVNKKRKSNEPEKQTEVKQLTNDDKNNQNFVETNDLLINHDKGILTLSYINKFQKKTYFKIVNENGTRVYNMEPSSSFIVHKRLLTSNLPEGEYKACLKVGDEEFSKSIYIIR